MPQKCIFSCMRGRISAHTVLVLHADPFDNKHFNRQNILIANILIDRAHTGRIVPNQMTGKIYSGQASPFKRDNDTFILEGL